MSLKEKTFFGFFWTFIDTFFIKGVTFLGLILIARLIGPEEFGIIGIIAVFISVGNSLIEGGLSSSLIRTKEVDHFDFSTIFFANILISILIYLIIYFSSPVIGDFFNLPSITQVIRVYCLIFLVSGLSSVQLAILTKKMRFKLLTLINIPSTVIGVIIGIYMAYNGYGVWSIVSLYIITQVIFSVLLWLNSSWKPSLVFSKSKLKKHYSFGYKLLISSLLDRIFKNIYNIIIGKFFPISTLGLFERAKKFSEYPSSTLTSVISKVTYPMLVVLRDDKDQIAIIYRRLLRTIFFITAPLLLGLAAIAEPMFKIILGKDWIEAIPFFQILCLSAMFYPIHSFNLNALKVYGRSDWFLKLEIIKKIIIVLALFVGFQFGIFGLIWSSLFTSVTALFINTFYSSKLINYSIKQQSFDMLQILLNSLVTSFIMLAIVNHLHNINNIIRLLVALFVGSTSYIFISYNFKKNPIHYIIKILKNKL